MTRKRWSLCAAWLIISVSLTGCTRSLGESLTEQGCLLHYTDTVPAATATTVLSFLASEGFCAGEGRLVQLTQGGDALQLRIATKPDVREDANYLAVAQAFAAQLSGKALAGAPVNVAICDEALETVQEAPGFRWGPHVALDACGVYAGEGITTTQAEQFLALVHEDLSCATARDFRLAQRGDSIDLAFVLEDAELTKDEALHQARLTAGRASVLLFDQAPVTVHVTDVFHTTQRSAPAVILGPASKKGSCTVFQGEGIDDARAHRFLSFVHAAGYCAGESKVYYLVRRGDRWRVATVLGSEVPPAHMTAFKTAFALIAAMFRGAVFEGEQTSVDLCDPVFEQCQSIIGPDYGRALTHKSCSIFHDPRFDKEQVKRLRTWLNKESFCDGPEQLFRIVRDGSTWAFHLAVRAQLIGTPELDTLAERLTGLLSTHVFEGESVSFIPTDQRLLPATIPR